jgi:hypothetical protein
VKIEDASIASVSSRYDNLQSLCMRADLRDFIFDREQLVINDKILEPIAGLKICWCCGGLDLVYDMASPARNVPVWEWHGSNCCTYRVHAKLCAKPLTQQLIRVVKPLN